MLKRCFIRLAAYKKLLRATADHVTLAANIPYHVFTLIFEAYTKSTAFIKYGQLIKHDTKKFVIRAVFH